MISSRRHAFQSGLSLLMTVILVAGCALPPTDSVAPVSASTPNGRHVATLVPPNPIEQNLTPESVVHITITSEPAGSQITTRIVTPTSSGSSLTAPTPTNLSAIDPEADPIIFTDLAYDQKCGHGDVAAADGHQLYATPRLLADNSNFLELLPTGSRVGIIDCVLWTDEIDVSWLAVRTPKNKLGWMIVQPDKFYVTLYPVPLEIHRAVTGVPAGATIAYVPPSGRAAGDASDTATATSIGLDFVPVVGDAKGVYEAATGYDMVTGEPLGNWRWLGLLGLIGLSEMALLRHGDEVADGARLAGKVDEGLRHGDEIADGARVADDLDPLRQADEALVAGSRRADEVADLARAAAKLDDAADAASDAAQAVRKGGAFSDETMQALAKFEQPCSFDADTLVSTDDGPIPISQIEIGDRVLAYNEAIGANGYYTVTATFSHLDSTILSLTIGEESIETTPEHPFFVDGRWLPAGEIEIGDIVLTANGTGSTAVSVAMDIGPQVMYNLTVTDAHTYFVGAGELLVHNACSRILRMNLDVPQEWEENGVVWQAHHVIPGQRENHPFVKRAKAGGWDIDGADNGVALPYLDEVAAQYNLPAHRGSHPRYSSNVDAHLGELEDRALAEGWSASRAADELRSFADELRKEILRRPAGQHLN